MWALDYAGDVEPADEAVVDDDALRSILALSFHGKDLDFLNKLSQEYRSHERPFSMIATVHAYIFLTYNYPLDVVF